MAGFPSTNPWDYDREFPFFRQPQILGSFSQDGERTFLPDRSLLQYHYPRQGRVSLDLNRGMQNAIRPKESKNSWVEKLDCVLRWILLNRSKFLLPNSERLEKLSTDFVCYRGLLRLLMCTPYERREAWLLKIVRWRGTIYILQVDTEEEARNRQQKTERDRIFGSYGYKFEQYMTVHRPGGQPDIDAPVDENQELDCIFRTRLGKHSVVFGAEMDAYKSTRVVEEKEPLVPSQFVEYKTSRIIETDNQQKNFRKFKLIKWWAQSFLVGIEEIVCGWRDDAGFVRTVESMALRSLPKMAAEWWQPNVCANFLEDFLSFLQELLRDVDNPRLVYSVLWRPGTGFTCQQEENASWQLLPSWYTEQIFR